LRAYEKAIELRPGMGLYWANEGDALDKLGFTTEADMAYAKAEELGYKG
jgi:Flp pilus assembly protein TadD